jgi:hypothetical protein
MRASASDKGRKWQKILVGRTIRPGLQEKAAKRYGAGRRFREKWDYGAKTARSLLKRIEAD